MGKWPFSGVFFIRRGYPTKCKMIAIDCLSPLVKSFSREGLWDFFTAAQGFLLCREISLLGAEISLFLVLGAQIL